MNVGLTSDLLTLELSIQSMSDVVDLPDESRYPSCAWSDKRTRRTVRGKESQPDFIWIRIELADQITTLR